MPKQNIKKLSEKENDKQDSNDSSSKGKDNKKKSNKETKQAFKRTLYCLNDYLDSCGKKEEEKPAIKEKEKKDNCPTVGCAVCVRASKRACDAPVLKELVNRIVVPIPDHLNCPCPCPVATSPATTFDLGTLNSFIALPCDTDCGERRVLWPLNDIIRRLYGLIPAAGTSPITTITARIVLNILVNGRLVIDPYQFNPVQNVDNIISDPCSCDQFGALTFSYTISVTNTGVPAGATGTFPIGTVVVAGPNGAGAPAVIEGTFLAGVLTNIAIGITSAAPSTGVYLSFVPSCNEKDKCKKNDCNKLWILVNLATLTL